MKDLRDTSTWDSPLSEDEKAWLRDRDRHAEIDAHEAKFSEAGDEDEATDDYDSWKKAELVTEADSRQPAVDSSGTAKEIIARLREWDAEHPDAE